jgi:glucoamylase
MLATFLRLRDTFQALYPINASGPSVAIGRYPEDQYDGGVNPPTREGNPWVLLTVGFGEFLYRSATVFEAKGKIEVTDVNRAFLRAMGWIGRGPITGEALADVLKRMRAAADGFVERVRFHGDPEGHFSEQINRHSGYMQGARDLTWSYGAFLTAQMRRPASKE